MKHQSWIANYENNFEQLAEEIGDLRYDTLADLLTLLAQKITRDGAKDASRGRTKLATSLAQTAELLHESTRPLRAAWDVCEPYLFPIDIIQKVKQEFATTTQKEVFRLLANFYKNWDVDTTFRLARCLLHQTNGNITKLQSNLENALVNPKEFITQSEQDKQKKWHHNFSRPFDQSAITAQEKDKGNNDLSIYEH